MRNFRRSFFFRLFHLSIFFNFLLIILLLSAFSSAVSPLNNYPIPEIADTVYLEDSNTKTYFKRLWYNFVASFYSLPASVIKRELTRQRISYVEIDADTNLLNSLDADLPASGRRYVEAEILESGRKKKVELRYRGASHYHWRFGKKSYLIRKKNGDRLHLINPKPKSFIAAKLAAQLAAEKFSLIVPDEEWQGLFINEQFKGVYEQVETIDDQFALRRQLTAVLKGENFLFDHRNSYSLFHDPFLWQIVAGVYPVSKYQIFIKAIDQADYQTLFSITDIDYLTRFYAWISFIQNLSHTDYSNWLIGIKDNKFYPIVWDPSPWEMIYQKNGNGVEEMASAFSRMLRRNIYFNQHFAFTLWNYLKDDNLMKWLNQRMKEEQKQLSRVLKYDLLKGGAYGTPNGFRAPQSTKDINEAIALLWKLIQERRDFLEEALSQAAVYYAVDQQAGYLYFKYDGIAGSYLESLFDQSNGTHIPQSPLIEVYNNGKFSSFSVTSDNGKSLLVAGRKRVEKKIPILGLPPYAENCPMVYRVKLEKGTPIKLLLRHSLTGELVKTKPLEHIELTDCQMDFTSPNVSFLPNEGSTKESNVEILNIKADIGRINDLFYFANQVNQQVYIYTTDEKGQATLSKQAYSDLIKVDFKTPFLKRKKWLVMPQDERHNKLIEVRKIAASLGLPTPISKLFEVKANGFSVGKYYFMEQPDKPFFEINRLTFDTDIYLKQSFNSLMAKSWLPIASNPRFKGSQAGEERLKEFLKTVENQDDLEQQINIANFVDFYNFLALTGNENLQYLLYFDNTQGKWLFIPYYYTFYKNRNFELKDPLIQKVFFSLSQKGYININQKWPERISLPADENLAEPIYATLNQERLAEVNYPSKYNLGIFEGLMVGNKIILPAGRTFIVEKDIIIPSHLILQIESGVRLIIAEGRSLVSYGRVTIRGEADKKVVIESSSNQPFGVFALVGKGVDGSSLEHVIFKNGSQAVLPDLFLSGMLSIYHGGRVTISNALFLYAKADDAVNVKYTDIEIDNSAFRYNKADGLDLDFSRGRIANNQFEENGNDNIDLGGSQVIVDNNLLERATDKCISVGEASFVVIKNNIIGNCHIGIAVKDSSQARISNNSYQAVGESVSTYQKKYFFDTGIVIYDQ